MRVFFLFLFPVDLGVREKKKIKTNLLMSGSASKRTAGLNKNQQRFEIIGKFVYYTERVCRTE